MERRQFLKTGLLATAAFTTLGARGWRHAAAMHVPPVPGPSPYGPLGPPDGLGIRLPQGFTARELARGNEFVPGTLHRWHVAPDGGATFATPDGGWIYVSNSEESVGRGGAGALRFAPDGSIADAYAILRGTSVNCAGGPTPWGTWLSCEEVETGLVWECDPTGARAGIPRPAMGMFPHEAAAVDPTNNFVYMTEDRTDGLFYRFRPSSTVPGHLLASGALEVARVGSGGGVTWLPVPQPVPPPVAGSSTRHQVLGASRFDGGEGMWFDADARTVYFATKGDSTIWAYHADRAQLEILFSSAGNPASPMNGVDNIVASAAGEIYVCEDHSITTPLEMILISPAEGVVAPFIEIVAPQHVSSELTGVAFDPSGTRMYFSSQRAHGGGATYEVTGPFRTSLG